MKVIGIIAEFNPFHNGHQYLIEKARQETNADYCIIVMSGDFVQRGAPAIVSKYTRAEIALKHGADVVIELPVAFATSSAEGFARAGVKLLHQLGVVDTICFGSENNAQKQLIQAAHILAEEGDGFKELLRKQLSKGMTYPQARMDALLNTMGFDSPDARIQYQSLLSAPNNVLGIEYTKALVQLKSPITIHTISRTGAGFHSDTLDGPYASATAIRKQLLSIREHNTRLSDLETVMPAAAAAALTELYGKHFPVSESDYYAPLLYQLQHCTSEQLTTYLDIPQWLGNRLINVWNESSDTETLIQLCKTKNVPYTTVSRALCHLLLQIPQALFTYYHAPDQPLPYIKVLGCRSNAMGFFSTVIKGCNTPCIMKLTDSKQFETDKNAMALWNLDLQATQLYQSIKTSVYHTPMENEFKRKLLIV